MMPVNKEIVREEADRIITSIPNKVNREYDNSYIGFSYSTKCLALFNNDLPYILDIAEAAYLYKRKKNYTRNPRKSTSYKPDLYHDSNISLDVSVELIYLDATGLIRKEIGIVVRSNNLRTTPLYLLDMVLFSSYLVYYYNIGRKDKGLGRYYSI
ncbi:hypothetical protein N7475_000966 [Penicillium sp. IBT 31633x]|nr:hypothetical protein N7475_000966 [Penicillium sp. IBT 31633x]